MNILNDTLLNVKTYFPIKSYKENRIIQNEFDDALSRSDEDKIQFLNQIFDYVAMEFDPYDPDTSYLKTVIKNTIHRAGS